MKEKDPERKINWKGIEYEYHETIKEKNITRKRKT